MQLYPKVVQGEAQARITLQVTTNVRLPEGVDLPTDLAVSAGKSQPLGATPDDAGVNFSIYSQHATRVELLLFADDDATEPAYTIVLDPELHRSFHFWHCYIADLKPGQLYAYRMDGPGNTEITGYRFNYHKVLLDPYARSHSKVLWDRMNALGEEDNVAQSMRSVVVNTANYDWEGDQPLDTPLADTIIYELHVRGFTRSPSSHCHYPGTFAGVIEKIPYLKELGITAVELLPIFDFDDQQVLRVGIDGKPLYNYWGYDPFGYFALQSTYCASRDYQSQFNEFRDMVKALHQAGIEVILDVVFNHTGEGNEMGPTISFRGQANEVYYHLWAEDRHYYMNFSGCGNTMNTNHPIVEKLIIECLTYWVTEYHVDGFRFDEASVLSRGPYGMKLQEPPVLWDIELLRELAEIKIIAEAWDADGLNQVNNFPGKRWCVWNGLYRDTLRRFVKGDPGLTSAMATRIAGSIDLFGSDDRIPINSINFITAHDGFTLYDLVSYNTKQNEANGEENRDGINENYSWNSGWEGPTTDTSIIDFRYQRIKNCVSILLLSRGVPMLLSGDEFGRTQHGNNNAYCQNNEISWFDWQLVEENASLLRFFQQMIAFRKRFSTLRRPAFFEGRVNERGLADVSWHGCQLGEPNWHDPNACAFAFTLAGFAGEPDLHVMLNMYHQSLVFELPRLDHWNWTRAIDTALPGPDDILAAGKEVPVTNTSYQVQGYSVVVFISQPTQKVES